MQALEKLIVLILIITTVCAVIKAIYTCCRILIKARRSNNPLKTIIEENESFKNKDKIKKENQINDTKWFIGYLKALFTIKEQPTHLITWTNPYINDEEYLRKENTK